MRQKSWISISRSIIYLASLHKVSLCLFVVCIVSWSTRIKILEQAYVLASLEKSANSKGLSSKSVSTLPITNWLYRLSAIWMADIWKESGLRIVTAYLTPVAVLLLLTFMVLENSFFSWQCCPNLQLPPILRKHVIFMPEKLALSRDL